MRGGAGIVLCLGLAACAGVADEGGVANYDALAKAQADCAAKGGELRLREFGNPEAIADFTCERK